MKALSELSHRSSPCPPPRRSYARWQKRLSTGENWVHSKQQSLYIKSVRTEGEAGQPSDRFLLDYLPFVKRHTKIASYFLYDAEANVVHISLSVDSLDLLAIWKLLSPSICFLLTEIPDRHYNDTFLQLKMLMRILIWKRSLPYSVACAKRYQYQAQHTALQLAVNLHLQTLVINQGAKLF